VFQQIEYGERFKVVGNQPALGSWDVTQHLSQYEHNQAPDGCSPHAPVLLCSQAEYGGNQPAALVL
jgi:hypothetical protein